MFSWDGFIGACAEIKLPLAFTLNTLISRPFIFACHILRILKLKSLPNQFTCMYKGVLQVGVPGCYNYNSLIEHRLLITRLWQLIGISLNCTGYFKEYNYDSVLF